MASVLFVCLGNICRSPLAEGIFRHLTQKQTFESPVKIDSAGTGSWHIGEAPDIRAQETARKHGVDIRNLKARQVVEKDFMKFDYIFAMDRSNMEALHSMCPPEYYDRLYMMMSFAPQWEKKDVPDPYFGKENGFEIVFNMLHDASSGVLKMLLEHQEQENEE